MSGSTPAIIVIPIVVVVMLFAWLVLVFYADSHPEPGLGGQPGETAPQGLSAMDACVSEAVSELETAGRSPTRPDVAALVGQDEAAVGVTLDGLVRRGVLRQETAEGARVYALAEVTRETGRPGGPLAA